MLFAGRGYAGLDLLDRRDFCIVHGMYDEALSASSRTQAHNYSLEWLTIEDHKAFMADTATYSLLLSSVQRYMNGLAMMHIDFMSDPFPAFHAPVAEITFFTAEGNVSREQVIEHVARVVKTLNEEGGAMKAAGTAVYGSCVEDQRVALVCGWESLEVSATLIFGTILLNLVGMMSS